MKLDAPTDNVANLKDMDKVGEWALPYVERCIAAGIINGDGNGNFDPAGKTVRIAAAKMLACLPEASGNDYKLIRPDLKIESKDPFKVPGEIMVRGEQVMSGYYKNEEATKAVLTEDGWLRTGDIGTMDPDGTIYIKGRCKTMILGPSGQNIYPEEIESKLNTLYLVSESLIVERDGKLVALVYPDYAQAKIDGIADDKIEETVKANLAELNSMVASYEKVSSIVIYPTEFEKTPKKSIKRYLYKA
jgi:long-subunit acyl-CoA synthetase (AMP-forming)